RYQKAEGAATGYLFPYQVGYPLLQPPQGLERTHNPIMGVVQGFRNASHYSYQILKGIGGLIVGSVPVKSLGGPIFIAQIAKESAHQGIVPYLTILAIISLNLFLLNLFPIPVLDGGQLVLLGLEKIKGNRLSRKFVEQYQSIGFVIVLSLVILATYNDLSRFWLSMLEGLGLGV
ncbi:MAG: site-2 protease family protein, partial [Proteobacteria bacterium]|nr:site-2 protease family protein [Pseudomonadota bacterium]